MRKIIPMIGWVLFATSSAFAQNPVQTMSPSSAATITNWYTQNLRDPTDPNIGNVVNDPLAGRSGRTAPVVIGVGGLVGFGEKDVGPYSAISTENNTGPVRRAR